MLSTLNSSTSPYAHNRNHIPTDYYRKTFIIRKSISNVQLDKEAKYSCKHTSCYNLDFNDIKITNSIEMPKFDDGQGLKCYHMSTFNLAKINSNILTNKKTTLGNNNSTNHHPSNPKKSSKIDKSHGESNIKSSNFISINKYAEFGIYKEIKEFFSFSRPCGFLMTFFGALLLISSSLWFYLIINGTLCSFTERCSDGVIKILMISALVCSVVFLFLGIVIIVYVKKEKIPRKIILPKSKYNSPCQQHKREQNNTKQKIERKESDIDMNEYNYEINEVNNIESKSTKKSDNL